MNESEWLGCTDPDQMLNFLGKKYSPRKLRLFAVACCRCVWDLLGRVSRAAVETAERFADGDATLEELDEASDVASADAESAELSGVECEFNPAVQVALRNAFKSATNTSAHAGNWGVVGFDNMEEWDATFEAERARHCNLLRDIYPFQGATVSPQVLAWSGGTVVKIAQGVYEEHRFEDLPVLADALEEAGCTDDRIIGHCRSGEEHVRGCWVVDVILGRT